MSPTVLGANPGVGNQIMEVKAVSMPPRLEPVRPGNGAEVQVLSPPPNLDILK